MHSASGRETRQRVLSAIAEIGYPLDAVARALIIVWSARRLRERASTEYARGVEQIIGAAVAFGLLGTLSTIAFRHGLTPALFTSERAIIGAVVLAMLVASRGEARIPLATLNRRESMLLGTAIVANGTLNIALFAAYASMSVALVLAIYFTYPLMVAMASVALGRERFTPARVAGLAVALFGLLLIIGTQLVPAGGLTVVGVACASVTALCQATYLVVSRNGYTRMPAGQATGIILTGGALIAGLVVCAEALSGRPQLAWVGSPEAWVSVIIAGTLCAAAAKVWLLRGVRIVGGTRSAVLMLCEPVVGVVAAALVLSQPVTALELVGGVAIVVGAALVQRPAAAPGFNPTNAAGV